MTLSVSNEENNKHEKNQHEMPPRFEEHQYVIRAGLWSLTSFPLLRQDGVFHSPDKLFELAKARGKPLLIAAPMVRYSKLPFRELCRDYGADVCYTPMFVAKEFIRHPVARDSDFSTTARDRPLIVQFGASNALEFARASEMVKPYCDGVNLNCGCPQTWAINEGIGCKLMSCPELVRDMVRTVKERCGEDFSVSVKIRIHKDLRETANWITVVETAKPNYIIVHGRRRSQRSREPVSVEAIAFVKCIATVPVVFNGDVFSMDDVERFIEATGVDGVMAARGILTNPGIFAGHKKTPWGAIERFLDYNMRYPLPFQLAIQHVFDMMHNMVPKKERASMMESCKGIIDLLDWLDDRFILRRRGEDGFGECIELERKMGT